MLTEENTIVRIGKAQHVPGDLLDEVGVGPVGGEERDVALELRAHGLETADLKVQYLGPLHQTRTRLEAVTPIDCVMDEVGRHQTAAKQHKQLPEPRSPIGNACTQHGVFVVTRDLNPEQNEPTPPLLKAR